MNAGSTVWQLNSSGDSYIAGWLIKSTRLATDNVCLESGNGVMGLYMSAYANSSFKTRTSNLEDFIDDRGGIYMQVKAASVNNPASANLAAYNVDGYRVFKLKTDGVSYIAGWAFDNSTLYTGTAVDISGSYTGSSGHITIGPNGLRGYKWRFEDTGAGALAGGNISWDAAGNVTFGASVSLNWTQGINEAKGLANSAQKSADISQQMAYGKMLFRDPEFSGTDYNGSDQYPFNMATGASSRALVTDNDAPNSTHKVMEITNTSWANEYDLRLGGFYFANQSRANAKFAVRIIAKIPLYWKIQNYHNQYGEDAITEWLTSTAGTGKYEEYICVVKCGANGTFSTINHFALVFDGPTGYSIDTTNNSASNLTIYVQDSQGHTNTISSVVWDIAYASVVDLTSSDKLTTAIDINGIYTGTLRADQIVAGTIDATNIASNTLTSGAIISNGNAWALKKDGSGYLANGNISWTPNGYATFVGFLKKGKTIITNDNINDYKRDDITSATVLDFDKCGTWIELADGLSNISWSLPILSNYIADRYTDAQKDLIRSFIGTNLLIFNRSGSSINLVLNMTTSVNTYSISCGTGQFILLECVLDVDDGKENVKWVEVKYGVLN